MGKKEQIYELASGYFTEEVNHVVNGVEILDEFQDGSTCSQLYAEITELKRKICERLQVDEDYDLEQMIDCMEELTKHMAMKMYEYGTLIGAEK